MPIKRVGPNKRVGWILLNTFVCLCVCFFLHVSLVPNKRLFGTQEYQQAKMYFDAFAPAAPDMSFSVVEGKAK